MDKTFPEYATKRVFDPMLAVYTETEHSVSLVITNLSNGHYGVWEFEDGLLVWRGEFFQANLIVAKPMCYGTVV